MLKRTLIVSGLVIGLMGGWVDGWLGAAEAAVPAKLSYEGRLLDDLGDPVMSPTNVQFVIYDAASGGTDLWTSDTISVTPDSNGVFTTLITNESSPLSASIFSTSPRYLQVIVGGETISSRSEFGAAPFAYRAAVADSYTGNTITGTLTVESGDLHVSSGNVGIGTDSPSTKLHISDTSTSALWVENTAASSSSGGASLSLRMNDGSALADDDRIGMIIFNGSKTTGVINSAAIQAYTAGGWTDSSTPSELRFETTPSGSTSRSIRMLIGSDGNVGIGTTSPNTLLDLAGVHRQVAKITSYSSTYTDYRGHPTLLFRKSHSDTLGTNATTLNGEEVGALEFEAIGSDTNPGAIAKIDVQQAGTAGSGGSWRTPGKMLFYLTDASNLGSVVTPLYLTSDNRVGIGTTPSTNLHVFGNAILADNTTIDPDSYSNSVVAGSIADGGGWVATGIGGNSGAAGRSWGIAGSGGNVYFGCQNGSSVNTMQTYMMFDANRDTILNPTSGNVGIGTASPYGKLSLYSGTSNDYLVIDAPAAYQSAVAWYSAGAQKWALYRPADSSDLLLYEGAGGGANRVAFKAGGNVGIGTTSPSGNLHVSNPAATSASIEARIQGSSQATCLEVGEDGTDNKMMRLHYWGSSYSQTNNNYPNMALIAVGNDASNGLTLRTGHADAPIKFDTNGSTNERMRITGAGDVGIGTTEPSVKLHVVGDSTSHLARFLNTNTETPGSSGLHVSTSGTGSGGRSIVDLYSNNFGDREFYFNDIGNAKCDGSWLTGGADFAEWFEKEEAVPEGALVGLNLDTGKVRVWRKGDPYVGVQSVNPGFIGNGIGGADSQDDELRKTHVLVALIGQVLIKHGEIIEQDRKVTTADGQFVGWKLADGRVFIK
ncbi:hypothetical protein ACFL1W_00550 [Candidatus Margulisiibacteriota bacterium]